MAHFVRINENNIVQDAIVVRNEDIRNTEFPESELFGQKFIKSLGLEGKWLQTSYNRKFRKNYAGPGWIYDPFRDIFHEPKPFDSWMFNEEIGAWEAPVNPPDARHNYRWNEAKGKWLLAK